ncbi:MAG: DsrE family protein [Candidatus Dormibacteria bacterium]
MSRSRGTAVVLVRSALSGEGAALGVRVALALPLGGVDVALVLAGAAAALALATPPELGSWAGALGRELEALGDAGVEVGVERESLDALGLGEASLRPGFRELAGQEVEQMVASARSCLVL